MKRENENLKKRSQLVEILENNKGLNTDVIAGLSGGKDSLYQLYLLSKEFGLRVKAFTWDHYHAYPAAIKSAALAVKNLGNIEWVTTGYRFDYTRKLIKAYLKEVKRFCICPHFMMLRSLPMAIDEKIPFIAIAYSPDQNARKGKYQIPEPQKRAEILISYAHSFKNLTEYCLQQTFPGEAHEITEYFFSPLMSRLDLVKKIGNAPTILQLSQFLPWHIKEMNSLIYDQFKWKKQGQKNMHSNCLYEPIRGYMEYKLNRPFLREEAEYLVQKGEINEQEAEIALASMNVANEEPKVLDNFCQYIDLPKDEFLPVLNTPMKERASELLTEFIGNLFVFQGFKSKDMGQLIN